MSDETRYEEKRYDDQSGWNALVSGLRRPAIFLPAIAVVTFLLYSGTLLFQFVWDDKAQIIDNPIIRSLSNLHRVFISDLWYHTGRYQLYYRPLFTVWSMFNYAAVGLRSWGWHLGAVLMHIAAVMAVFWLLRKLGLEYWTAALATLIFALHPIHIECVAWISAVSDSMVTALAALAFVAFLKEREPGNNAVAWRLASLAMFAGALFTKEIVLGLPVLVALYDWLYPLNDSSELRVKIRSAIRTAIPYAAVTVGYLVLRKVAFSQLTGRPDPNHNIVDIFLALPYVLAFYLKQLFLPLGLTGLYFTPYNVAESPKNFIPAVLVLALATLLIYFWAKKKADNLVLFAALWMPICLAPALYLRTFSDGDFVRDRYMYLGSIGFVILIAKAIRQLPAVSKLRAGTLQGVVAAVLCFAYVGMSLDQQPFWNSDLLVYSRGYQLYPENAYAAIGLATEYSRLGAYDRAIPLVEAAHRMYPDYLYASYALAYVYIQAGHMEQGRAALLNAQLMPEYMKGQTGAASVAAMWGQLGDYDRARALCARVLAEEPDLYSGLYNCGNVQLMSGHYAEAERLLQRAVQTAPELASPRHFLGRALFLDGNYAAAHAYLSQAVAMDPTVYDYHYWLGRSFEQNGDKLDAKREYLQALQLNQGSVETKLRLAGMTQP